MALHERIWHGWLKRPYRLHIEDTGGDLPVVVLLHGIAASSASWHRLITKLEGQYRCISIDLIGFGKSPKPQQYGYTMDEHLRNIHAAIRRLHLKQQYTLVGHSLGSLLATRYVAVWPKRVERLVLLSPPVYPPLETIASKRARRRDELLLRIYRFLRTHPRATPENLRRLGLLLPLPKVVVREAEMWLPFCRTLEQCIENQTIVQDIVNIQVPIDIFYQTLDPVLVTYNIRQLQTLQKVDLHQIKGANHIVTERYATIVSKLLQ